MKGRKGKVREIVFKKKKKVPVVSECRARRASSSLWMLCGVGGVLTNMQNRQKEHKGFSVM